MRFPWKRPREEKSSGGLMVALAQLGAAQWGGRDVRSLIRDGYLRNAIAYRCVRMISEAAASVPLSTHDEALGGLLKAPNLEQDGVSLLEEIYAHLQIAGNAYLEAVTLADDARPRALYVLRPDRMKAITDTRGWPTGWVYRVGNTKRQILRDEHGWSPVLQLKLFNPADDVYGAPPLASARQALDLHNASADWAKSLIDNSARPSGALIYGKDGGRMTDDQFDRLKAELESAHAGALNAGKPMLLDGGLDWKPMSLSPADMDFLDSRNGAAREIALAFGVPPMLLGIPGDNTYANYKEANIAFWRLTVLPLAQKAAAALGRWLGPHFSEDARVQCDHDNVPALAVEREALWARIEQASYLSNEEKRALVGLSPEGTHDAD